MLFPKRPDYKVITNAGAMGTSYSLTLSREFWLESIILKITGTTQAGALGAFTPNGFWALLKRARMSVTDATGNRKILDCPGYALQEYWRQTVGNLDRSTISYAPTTAAGVVVGVSTAFTMYIPIPFRNPVLQDPFGAATMLPLPRLSNDPVLEFDIAPATDISATFGLTGNLTISALINRRDVLAPGFPYVPGELITYAQPWSSNGKNYWTIPPMGTITGILMSDFTSAGLRNSVLASNSEDWSIEYLSTVIRRQNPDFIQVENDHTVEIWPATWNNPAGSLYLDFLTDYANQDAFNMGSCLDVNPLVLNGGQAKIVGSNITGTGSAATQFTVHKLFGDLRQVKFA
jgi:hypothetical protein